MTIRIGCWDCKYCGNKTILGPKTHCPDCGASRPEDVLFYLPPNAQILIDEEKIKEAELGPDWVCSSCNGHNKAWHRYCGNCGSPFLPDDKEMASKEYDEKSVPISSEKPKDYTHPDLIPPRKMSFGQRVKRYGIVGAILSTITFWIASFNASAPVEVVGHEWKREMKIEKYVFVQEEGWSLPPEGNLIKQWSDIHHKDKKRIGTQTKTRTVKVPAGEEEYVCGKIDMGNGYFKDKRCTRTIYKEKEESYEEDVFQEIPVYKTKYRYSIYRWKPDESILTQGKNHQAEWGTKNELDNPQKFRIVHKKGEYFVLLKTKGNKEVKEKACFEKWQKLEKGKTLAAIKSRFYGYYKSLKEPIDSGCTHIEE